MRLINILLVTIVLGVKTAYAAPPLPPSKAIVLLTLGTRGDIMPFVPLYDILEQRGFEPYLATHIAHEQYVTDMKMRFLQLPGDQAYLKKYMTSMSRGGLRTFHMRKGSVPIDFIHFIKQLNTAAYEKIRSVKPRAVLSVSSMYAAPDIAEALNIPILYVQIFPKITESNMYPQSAIDTKLLAMMGSRSAKAYAQSLVSDQDSLLFESSTNTLRREMGLNPSNSEQRKQRQEGIHSIYGHSPTFLPPQSASTAVIGFWPSVISAPPEVGLNPLFDELESFILNKAAVVYIGFGSIELTADWEQIILEQAMEIAQSRKASVIIHQGGTSPLDILAATVPNVEYMNASGKVVQNSDQAAIMTFRGVLPHQWFAHHLAVAVHHGGAGTTHTFLQAGVPSVIHPFYGDQFIAASTLETRNIGSWARSLSEIGDSVLNILHTPNTFKEAQRHADHQARNILNEDLQSVDRFWEKYRDIVEEEWYHISRKPKRTERIKQFMSIKRTSNN